jgi:hypothetical protein
MEGNFMRYLRTLALSTLLGASLIASQVEPSLAQTCACPVSEDNAASQVVSRGAIIADDPPPPLPVYEQPPIPASGYIWTPGYWAWNNYEHYWVPGTWVEPPKEGLLWTPGYWGVAGGLYHYHHGYWGPHVGFYGGISYGFGYDGEGYEGGHWEEGRFFYNRSVTNITDVNITNVYNKTIVVHDSSEIRVSFNGGPNGTAAKPTAAQLVVAKEVHVPPTPDQVKNARVASRTESAFVSTNHGKPAVAATAKPGELTGPAVVAAKSAGGPIETKPEVKKPDTGQAKPEERKSEAKPEQLKPAIDEKKPADKPEEPKPAITPDEKKPAAKPEEPKPAITPDEKKPAAKPEEPKPAITPDEKKPAAKSEERKSEAKPERECGHPGQPACPK